MLGVDELPAAAVSLWNRGGFFFAEKAPKFVTNGKRDQLATLSAETGIGLTLSTRAMMR